MIQTVKQQENGYRVTWDSGQVSFVPTSHRFIQDVQAWIDAGNTPEALETVDERKQRTKGEADREYQASLARGFSFDGGTWPAAGEGRRRVIERALRVTAASTGRAKAALPNGKSAVTLVDMNGTPHQFNANEIADLAEAGDDLVDAADSRLFELRQAIDAATSDSDLDAIDTTEGWPN
jgi:hypothetical protein